MRTKLAEKGVGAKRGFRWRGGAKCASFSGIIYLLTWPVVLTIYGFINSTRRRKLESEVS
ncbi:MAG: hypothetical protein WAR21_07525 [Candidatus Acidiferrales bacterium]